MEFVRNIILASCLMSSVICQHGFNKVPFQGTQDALYRLVFGPSPNQQPGKTPTTQSPPEEAEEGQTTPKPMTHYPDFNMFGLTNTFHTFQPSFFGPYFGTTVPPHGTPTTTSSGDDDNEGGGASAAGESHGTTQATPSAYSRQFGPMNFGQMRFGRRMPNWVIIRMQKNMIRELRNTLMQVLARNGCLNDTEKYMLARLIPALWQSNQGRYPGLFK